MQFRSRIAPTPSGYLHIGNVYSFILTWVYTRLNNGHLLLRIDDMDGIRCRNEYLQDIFDTLQFLGIDYNEGPKDLHDFKTNFTQTIRLPQYHETLQKLVDNNQLYACVCSRKQLAANDNNRQENICREKKLPFNTPNSALRICLEASVGISFLDEIKGAVNMDLKTLNPDFVVRQKDRLPSYQLCSLVDDTLFGITHIVRGEDLLVSTASQLYLAATIGYASFQRIRFFHHPLIPGLTGKKLSKSAGDTSIKSMRSNGFSAKDIYKKLGNLFGIDNLQVSNATELLQFIIENDLQEIGIFAKQRMDGG